VKYFTKSWSSTSTFLPFFLPELTRRASDALVVAVLAVGVAPAAHAAGTWETTLQGRDLDGVAATFEAYYDTALNITWLADANYAQTSGYFAANDSGGLTWDEARTWAAQLNINGVTGWRLPDVKPVNGSSFEYDRVSFDGSRDLGYNITSTQSELAHLYHVTLGNKSSFDALGDRQPDFGLQNTGPFSIDQSIPYRPYWSGVEFAPSADLAWVFRTSYGYQDFDAYKSSEFSAWAVHSGDVAAVPEPQTYAMALGGLAAVLVARRQRV
jgi:hypothetical protein